MAALTGVGVLYLIAKSLQIDCNYCVLGENAIPLNICYNQSSLRGSYQSYEYQSQSNTIIRIDYTNYNCNDNDGNKQIYRIEIADHAPLSLSCLSNQYALIEKIDNVTGEREEKGIIINKCISFSSPISNVSRYTQCNQQQQLKTWLFDDTQCTQFDSVITHSLNDWYEDKDTILTSINCPYCDPNIVSYNIQSNMRINYVIINDATYTFPEAINVCNKQRKANIYGSYKYQCIRNTLYKAIWNDTDTCYGLYDVIDAVPLTNVIDFNCKIWYLSEDIQTQYIKIMRYNAIHSATGVDGDPHNFQQISYIINHCIQQNEETFVIIECQNDLMIIHYYKDAQCMITVDECMSVFQSNSCNLMNDLYFEVIEMCVGDKRRVISSANHDVEVLGIDTETTQAPVEDADTYNYVKIRKYKEPLDKCNEYSLFGSKHSYKYVCIKDGNGNMKNIKKRKWKHKLRCDVYGDMFDEEEVIDNNIIIDYKCNGKQIDINIGNIVQANCFENDNYWEQTSVMLNSCITINDDTNSLYILCYSTFTITYYYHNNDCTRFGHKEIWYANNCESRYSELLLDCDYNQPSDAPTTTPLLSFNTTLLLTTLQPTKQYPTISETNNVNTETPSPLYPTPTPITITTSLPSLHPTVTPPTSVTYDSTMKPTSNPTTHPINANPTTNPTSNPATNPTTNPPTINVTPNPSNNPTINPTKNPTTITTESPAANPSTNPSANPSVHPSTHPTTNPTESPVEPPTLQHPTQEPPTVTPTPSPTESSLSIELYIYYNETQSAYWTQSTQTRIEYGDFIRDATFLSLRNITGHSMHYEDRDLYINNTWEFGGITHWRSCYVFDEKLMVIPYLYTCPTINNLNPTAQGAQFAAVAESYVVSDADTTGFKEYILQKLETEEFMHYVQLWLNKLVPKSTPSDFAIESIHILDKSNTFVPSHSPSVASIMVNPTKPTWSKVTDRRNAFLRPPPLPYQGLFVNEPPVSGDIFIILCIILSGMISVVGCCMLFKKNC